MPITPIQPGSNSQSSPLVSQVNQAKQAGETPSNRFATVLDNQVLAATGDNSASKGLQAPVATPPTTPSTSPDQNGLIPLGKIDKTAPSISHLLTGDTAYQHESWNIIYAKVNKNKQFTTMQHGTVVSLNPISKELVWAESQSRPQSINDSVQSPLAGDEGGTEKLQPAETTAAVQIPLGTLDADIPTLSHLLKNHPQYSDNAWNIIFAAPNRHKPYTSLRPGCQVSINPQTLELSFTQKDGGSADPVSIAAKTGINPQPLPAEINNDPSQRQFSEKLAESVKSYLGQPYHEIDCYALVVKGLKDQGVQYNGSGGLRNHLERMAARHGLPTNAYQNGEGLIEIAGHKLYDKSFARIKDAERQSASVMEQLQPLLQEGMLLSFSTPRRGHTGVIAKKDGQWTYVNSGVIDHQVDGGKISKRVGEEKLEEEIKNWFLLAKDRRTSLKVSAGLFDTQKLKAKGNMVATNKSNDRDMT